MSEQRRNKITEAIAAAGRAGKRGSSAFADALADALAPVQVGLGVPTVDGIDGDLYCDRLTRSLYIFTDTGWQSASVGHDSEFALDLYQAVEDAQRAADAANAELANIASDNVLSAGEKPRVVQDYTVIAAEQEGIDREADHHGIVTEKQQYDDAVLALVTYLNTLTTPVYWSNLSGHTAISGPVFRARFADVYTTRQQLLNEISRRAGDAAVAAQRAAELAMGQLTDIASDNVLSAQEKPRVIQDVQEITNERAGILAEADRYAIITERLAYDNSITALLDYLAGLTSPVAWNNTADYTDVNSSELTAAFLAVYSNRQTLLNAIAARTVRTDGNGNVTGTFTVGHPNLKLDGAQARIVVSDGSVDRVRLGKLDDVGSYGLELRDADDNLIISSSGSLGTGVTVGGVPMGTIAANAAVPPLTFIGNFASPPDVSAYPINSIYRNTVDTYNYVLVDSAGVKSWQTYLQGGAPGADAKVLSLQASSQVIQVSKVGVETPSTVTLTAVLAGALTGVASFTLVSGTATLTPSSNTCTVTNLTTDTVTVRASIVDGAVTYSDTITVVKVREGADGTPAVSAYLTNESHTLAAATDGTVSDFTGASTDIKIFIGATDDSANWTVSRVNSSGVSSTLATRTVTITAMTVDTGYVDITASRTGYASLTRRFSISKSKTGSTGLNAKFLTLSASSQVFQVKKDGSNQPASVTLTAVLGGALSGVASWTVTAGTATLTGSTANVRTLTYANLTTDSATIQASINDGTGTYGDTITVVKVREGLDGATGAPGVTAILTNEAHTLAADSAGVVASYAGATTDVKVYLGATDDSANWTASKLDGPGVTSTLSTRTVTVTNLSSDSGYVDITVSRGGYASITKRFSLVKSKTGAQGATGSAGATGATGANALTCYLTTEAVAVPCDAAGNPPGGTLATTSFVVMNGPADDTANWSLSVSPASSGASVTWSLASNTLTVTGFSNTIDTHVLTFTATRASYPTLTKKFTLSKSKAGATGPAGSAGATGTRGSMTFYVDVQPSVAWSDTSATNACAAYGGNKIGDTVTEYNNVSIPGWSETRFWSGSAWISPGTVLNGNLLVNGTVGAAALAASSVTTNALAAGAVTADKIVIGSGSNLLYNSDFSGGVPTAYGTSVSGWTVSVLPTGWVAGGVGLYTGSGWSVNNDGMDPKNPYHNNSFYVSQLNCKNDSSSFVDTYAILAVQPGKRYAFSGYVGAHRCKVRLCVTWLKADGSGSSVRTVDNQGLNGGASYTESDGTVSYFNADEYQPTGMSGGTLLSGYNRLYVVATAPSDAVKAAIVFRKFDTDIAANSTSNMFVTRAQVEEVYPGTRFPGPWVPSASTIINGNGIATNSITTNHISAVGLDASVIKAGTIDANRISVVNLTSTNLVVDGTPFNDMFHGSRFVRYGTVEYHKSENRLYVNGAPSDGSTYLTSASVYLSTFSGVLTYVQVQTIAPPWSYNYAPYVLLTPMATSWGPQEYRYDAVLYGSGVGAFSFFIIDGNHVVQHANAVDWKFSYIVIGT